MRRSILQRRQRRRVKSDFELPLTSMMDMLIILIVFLLKSYSANSIAFATSPNIKLPTSAAEELPADSASLIIDLANITVDGEKVMDFKDKETYEIEPHLLGDGGRKILPLYDALVRIREKAEIQMSKAIVKDKEGRVVPAKYHGTLVIHADKNIRYEVLRRVMYTAGAAEFRIFKLLTVKKDT